MYWNQNMNVYILYVYTMYIYIYTITLPIFICGFHAVLTQALPRQVHWPKSPKKMVFSLDDTAPKNNPFPPTSTYSSDLPVWKGEGWKVTSPESAPCISCGVFHGPRALASKKIRGSTDRWKHHDRRKKNSKILLMEEPLHQLMWNSSHYLQGLQCMCTSYTIIYKVYTCQVVFLQDFWTISSSSPTYKPFSRVSRDPGMNHQGAARKNHPKRFRYHPVLGWNEAIMAKGNPPKQ